MSCKPFPRRAAPSGCRLSGIHLIR